MASPYVIPTCSSALVGSEIFSSLLIGKKRNLLLNREKKENGETQRVNHVVASCTQYILTKDEKSSVSDGNSRRTMEAKLASLIRAQWD